MEEKIGKRLPDSQARDHSRGNQSEALDELILPGGSRKVMDERFKNENTEVRKQQYLHAGRDVKVEADAIALYARPGCHNHQVYGVGMPPSKWPFGQYSSVYSES